PPQSACAGPQPPPLLVLAVDADCPPWPCPPCPELDVAGAADEPPPRPPALTEVPGAPPLPPAPLDVALAHNDVPEVSGAEPDDETVTGPAPAPSGGMP